MESKAGNDVQGDVHIERCSQGFERRWHIYLNNFWPGLKNELLVLVSFVGSCLYSNLLQNSCQPHFRRPIFNAPDFTWSVEWTTFGETFHYFVYVLKKVSHPSSLIFHFVFDTKNNCLFVAILLRYCIQGLNKLPRYHVIK